VWIVNTEYLCRDGNFCKCIGSRINVLFKTQVLKYSYMLMTQKLYEVIRGNSKVYNPIVKDMKSTFFGIT